MSDGAWGACYKCKCRMWLPMELETAARAARGRIAFYCAYGHGQVYAEGESEETKLRRERDRLAQQIAERDDEIARQRSLRETAEHQASAARGQVTRIKNRVSHGVCPCCNRTFTNLARHIAGKHPDFNNVVPLESKTA